MKLDAIALLEGVELISNPKELQKNRGGCEIMCRVAVTVDCVNQNAGEDCYFSGYDYCIEFCK